VSAPDFRSVDQHTGQVVCETCGYSIHSYEHYTECEGFVPLFEVAE
jgi:hypothetical protein